MTREVFATPASTSVGLAWLTILKLMVRVCAESTLERNRADVLVEKVAHFYFSVSVLRYRMVKFEEKRGPISAK